MLTAIATTLGVTSCMG
ncbi:smalltalk protein [Segatella copri]|nr:smalltalk protein [Segatella copri]